MADYLANYTMDEGRSWFQICSTHVDANAGHFLIQTDGGSRAGQCSAAAWVIEVVSTMGDSRTTSPLVTGGTYISTPVSSFTAEAMALDEAARAVSSLVQSSKLPSQS